MKNKKMSYHDAMASIFMILLPLSAIGAATLLCLVVIFVRELFK